MVRLPAINWLSRFKDTVEAVYITKFLAKQKALPIEAVVDILTWCRTFPTNEDAIWRLTQLDGHLLKAEIAEDVIVTCEAVLAPLVLEGGWLEPVTRGQITVLVSYIIGSRGLRSGEFRTRVDNLLMAWLRNPLSFGSRPLPHIGVQRTAYVQRIADLIASDCLSVTDDHEPLERFLEWVNNWEPKRKLQLLPIFEVLWREYPVADLWDVVEFV